MFLFIGTRKGEPLPMQRPEHDAPLTPPSKTAPGSSRLLFSVLGAIIGLIPPGLAIMASFIQRLPPPPPVYPPEDFSGMVFFFIGSLLQLGACFLSVIVAFAILLRSRKHPAFPRGLFIGHCLGLLACLIFYWPSLVITVASQGVSALLLFAGLVAIPPFLAIPPLFLHRKRDVPEKES